MPFDAEQFELAANRLRAQVEPATWAQAWANGQLLSLDEAVHKAEGVLQG